MIHIDEHFAMSAFCIFIEYQITSKIIVKFSLINLTLFCKCLNIVKHVQNKIKFTTF